MPELPEAPAGPNGSKQRSKSRLTPAVFRAPVNGARKIAIVGFTEHRNHAPFKEAEWQMWFLNDLYHELPDVDEGRIRWFQLHSWAKQDYGLLGVRESPPAPRDPAHVEWLEKVAAKFSVYLMEQRPEVPDALVLPRAALEAYFGSNYFTNTISWMLGLAIMEIVGGDHIGERQAPPGSAIGVWGVDMMVAGGPGSEYGWQRPSCEWLLGAAMAAGIKVHIPDESDLLKTAFPYGDNQGNAFRNKVDAYRHEMSRRRGIMTQQRDEAMYAISELTGAINAIDHLKLSWMPGDGEFSPGRAPEPNSHKGTDSPLVRAPSPPRNNPGE